VSPTLTLRVDSKTNGDEMRIYTTRSTLSRIANSDPRTNAFAQLEADALLRLSTDKTISLFLIEDTQKKESTDNGTASKP
jgi:hypothetical protein